MNRGVLLIAHNNSQSNYYDFAIYTAKRVQQFLNLPVSIITDPESDRNSTVFENKYIIEPDKNNLRKTGEWINTSRYMAYELSPYDETILLDVDYNINSNALNNLFKNDSDFLCHYDIKYFFNNSIDYEPISHTSVNTFWATVIKFKKTLQCKQIFDIIKMIQNNYYHYQELHGFLKPTYRNDYALTLAHRIVYGHMHIEEHNIPWRLLHVPTNVKIVRESDTEYVLIFKTESGNKYITIKDLDFHVLSKQNFMELIT